LPHDVERQRYRDRETDPLRADLLAENRGVDADQLAARIDQRAPGIARVDEASMKGAIGSGLKVA